MVRLKVSKRDPLSSSTFKYSSARRDSRLEARIKNKENLHDNGH